MRRVFGYIAIATTLSVSISWGQSLVYDASVFSGYSTSAYPFGTSAVGVSRGASQLGSDVSYGASAGVGWQRNRDRMNFSARYTATYAGSVNYSDLNALNHALSFGDSIKLSPKWTVNLSGTGQISSLSQFVFQPTSLNTISQVPANFDDLAAAFSIGQFSDTQIGSKLTGAPALDSPIRSLLLGNRVLSYSTQAGLSYAASSRLTFHFAGVTAAGQHLSSGKNDPAQPNYVMPRSIGLNAGMGLSYSLSPRTQLGLDVEENRISSHYQSAYNTTASASVGRKMGMHWFLNMSAGGAFTQVIQQTSGTPATRSVVGGGSMGYQTYGHTFVASYNRSAADVYGFGAGINTSLGGAWTWHRPGTRWSLSSSFGQQQSRNTGFESISGWEFTTGLSERLDASTSLTAQYVYLKSDGTYLGNLTNLSVQSVRVSMGWAHDSSRR